MSFLQQFANPIARQRQFKDWLGYTAATLAADHDQDYLYWRRVSNGSEYQFFSVVRTPNGEKSIPFKPAAAKLINAWAEWVEKGEGAPPEVVPKAAKHTPAPSMPALATGRSVEHSGRKH